MVLDGDPTRIICSDIDFLLRDFHNKRLLNKNMVDFCSPPKKAHPARLYFLKKIHKNPMGIQPIVSSCESPTENISQFIDFWLQPLTKALPSYVKDTSQLINKLKEVPIEPNTLLVTPLLYKRYNDDILILWPHSELELDNFLLAMNSFHPSIKFTSERSYHKITFLDINIYKSPHSIISKKLEVETFIKPTNRQAYIHAKSFHPPGVSKGVALGEMKRYLRTNSCVDTFKNFKARHKINLRRRGYSSIFINHFTDKVKFWDH